MEKQDFLAIGAIVPWAVIFHALHMARFRTMTPLAGAVQIGLLAMQISCMVAWLILVRNL